MIKLKQNADLKKKKKKERSRAGEPVGESEGERVVTDYGYGAVL